MAKEFAYSFYHSSAWRKCRKHYIKERIRIDGGMCETCHDVPGYIVHHKTELTPANIGNPRIALSFNNLKYDCLRCHNKENKYGEQIEGLAEYIFDANGMPIQQTPPIKSC